MNKSKLFNNSPKSIISSLFQQAKKISADCSQRLSCLKSLKSFFLVLSLSLFGSLTSVADVNVLIVGGTYDSRDDYRINGGSSEGFNPAEIGTQLQSILGGASLGTVNVVVEDRTPNTLSRTAPLISWFYYPYPEGVDTTTRWPNLRGENGTDWDYVVIIGDPYCMEQLPGIYAQGVAKVAEEVVKGGAEPILLMPWPAQSSTATIAHYKEVVYRAGRTSGYKVAPAALAWQANASPSVGGHPNADGAYIAAASVYSRIWNKSASTSTYTYNDSMADKTATTVSSNVVATQYTGRFTFHSPTIMGDDKNRFCEAYPGQGNKSSENGNANAIIIAHDKAGVTRSSAAGSSRFYAGREGIYDRNLSGIGFGFAYQTQTTGNNVHHSEIFTKEMNLADDMLSQGPKHRLIPRRMLWAEFSRQFPDERATDGGEHVSDLGLFASGTYIYTLVSGRCPLDPKPDPITKNWLANKIGYEAAWNMGRCQTRAPGFKVTPSKVSRHSIDASNPELMVVQFILPPKKNVTVSISSTNPDVTVSPQTLTFTPANYDQPQNVSVTPIASLAPGETTNIKYITVSEDEVYDGLDDSWFYYVNTQPVAYDVMVDVVSGSSVEVIPTGSDDIDYKLGFENPDLTYNIETQPSKGTVVSVGRTAFIYTSNPGSFGQDSFTHTVHDGSGSSVPATVIVNIIDGDPRYNTNLVYNGNAELIPFTAHGWTNTKEAMLESRRLPPPIPIWPGVKAEATPENAPVPAIDLRQGYTTFRAPAFGRSSPKGQVAIFQDVDVTMYSGDIVSGSQAFTVQGYSIGGGDEARIIAECRAANGQLLTTHDSGINVGGRGFKKLTFYAPVSTTQIRVTLHVKEAGGRRTLASSFDEITLLALRPGSPFVTWSNDINFGDDANDDNVSNGLAWALGADDPSVVATGLLPTPELGIDPIYYVFNYRRSDDAHIDPNTTICAEYSLDINEWIECEEVDGNANIKITEIDDGYEPGVDKIEVKILRSLANGKAIFCRLKVTQ